jgi:hypothetical protein
MGLQVCKTRIQYDLGAFFSYARTERDARFPGTDSAVGSNNQKKEKERKDHSRKRESKPHRTLVIEELSGCS